VIDFVYCFRASQKKEPTEMNRKPMVAIDRENESEKRRKEAAKPKELRDKQEVNLKKISSRNKSFYLGG
jgi:hypothetical protein